MSKQIGTIFGPNMQDAIDASERLSLAVRNCLPGVAEFARILSGMELVIPDNPTEPILLVPEPDDTKRITVIMDWPEECNVRGK